MEATGPGLLGCAVAVALSLVLSAGPALELFGCGSDMPAEPALFALAAVAAAAASCSCFGRNLSMVCAGDD